jgi:uncharacterized protein YabN with tetrapyrrole methylase and pyrophosphatase domain
MSHIKYGKKVQLEELQVEVKVIKTRLKQEFGDVLFSMINYARFLNVNLKMLWNAPIY